MLGFFLGDKRSLPPDLVTTVRAGLRVLAQGSPAWGLLRGEDARALFTGVARARDFDDAVTGEQRAPG